MGSQLLLSPPKKFNAGSKRFGSERTLAWNAFAPMRASGLRKTRMRAPQKFALLDESYTRGRELKAATQMNSNLARISLNRWTGSRWRFWSGARRDRDQIGALKSRFQIDGNRIFRATGATEWPARRDSLSPGDLHAMTRSCSVSGHFALVLGASLLCAFVL